MAARKSQTKRTPVQPAKPSQPSPAAPPATDSQPASLTLERSRDPR